MVCSNLATNIIDILLQVINLEPNYSRNHHIGHKYFEQVLEVAKVIDKLVIHKVIDKLIVIKLYWVA